MNWDEEDYEQAYEPAQDRFISKEDAKPDNQYHQQEFACPNCGSYNTGQSTYTDYCKTCDWGDYY